MLSSRKRVWNNDRDDPGSQKQNGDDARNVYQKPRRTKEQIDEKYTRRNKQQNNAKEWISDLEDRTVEITAVEQNIKKRVKKR